MSASRSIRLPSDLDQRVEQAIAATGCNTSELAALCIGITLDQVVRNILDERRVAAADFLSGCAPHTSQADKLDPLPVAASKKK